ncbi:hypothetical protein ABT382_22885 [Streptomyces pharetrae]|uniref:hypothetical protein n=1 Tax=Streptomyces pharetrae TaxID=291370 RepID=UPI00335B6B3B
MARPRSRKADVNASLRRARQAPTPRATPVERSSVFRGKTFWAGVVGALVSGAGVVVWQSGWGWFQEEITGPPELKVYASDVLGCHPGYFDEPLDTLRGRAEDVSSDGGVRIAAEDEPVTIHVTLQGETGQAIVVTGAEVTVLSSDPLPTKGSVIDGECGGGVDERAFDVDFGQRPVTVGPQIRRTAQGTQAGRDFPFKVSSGDPEQFAFQLRNVGRDVRFAITLTWVSDGEPGTTRLDNEGRGYRVMGVPTGVPRYPLRSLYRDTAR